MTPAPEITQEAARAMLEALKMLDADWCEDFPSGPDEARKLPDGCGYLAEETIQIWRAMRAAIALAEGHAP